MSNMFKKADNFISKSTTIVTSAISNSIQKNNQGNSNVSSTPPGAFVPSDQHPHTADYYAKKPPTTEIPVAVAVPVPIEVKPPVLVVHPPANVQTTVESNFSQRPPVVQSQEEQGFGCKCQCCNACFNCFGSCLKSVIPPAWFLSSTFCTVGFIISCIAYASCEFFKEDDIFYGIKSDCPNQTENALAFVARWAAILSIALGGICLFLMVSPCLLCCCLNAMSKRQWKQCGVCLGITGILQLITLVTILDCVQNSCILQGGFLALPASLCFSGAAVSTYFVQENVLTNTVTVQRTQATASQVPYVQRL